MPISLTPDNTAPVAKALTVDPLPLPAAEEDLDASSAALLGTTDDAEVASTPAAPDNTPPVAIT